MGKPRKISVEVQENICKSLAAGIDIDASCVREGIGRQTYYDWRHRGEKGEEPFKAFLDATERALADAERRITFLVVKAAERDWKAGAWWLERRRPEVYGERRRHALEVSGPDGSPQQHEVVIMDLVTAKRIARGERK